MRLNQNGFIKWNSIDIELISDFESKYSSTNRIDRFLYSWIILNHYYSAWSVVTPPVTANGRKRITERDEIENFSQCPAAIACWDILKRGTQVSTLKINLPVIDGKGDPFPNENSQEATLSQLSLNSFLFILYYIRCDLFHGDRRLRGYKNVAMINFSSECCYQFVKLLIRETGRA